MKQISIILTCLLLVLVAQALPPFIGDDGPLAVAPEPPAALIYWTNASVPAAWAGATNSPGDVAALNAAYNYQDITSFTLSETNITLLTISGATNLLYIDASDNALTSVNFTNLMRLSEIYLNFNSITSDDVNKILVMLDAGLVVGGGTNGSITINNQTPAAPPTTGPPDGVAAKASLLSKGWIAVTTD